MHAALASELSTRALFERARSAGKPTLWPRARPDGALELARCDDWAALTPDSLGIPAPPRAAPRCALQAGDLVVLPGVAFTSDGARLGRGGGHYDRLLARRVGEARVGIAFDLQIVPEIPEEPHDQRMDLVVTPSRTWRTPR
jgi:5-formyltetrahydrofolate cyclo-ligase